MAEASAGGDEPGLLFDKPDFDETRYELQTVTPRFVGFLIIAVATFIFMLTLMWAVLSDYIVFAKQRNFPGPWVFFFGNLIAAILLVYMCYTVSAFDPNRRKATAIFWCFMFYNIFMIAWTINFQVRMDNFSKGLTGRPDRGDFHLVMALIFAVVLMCIGFSYGFRTGFAMLLVVIWVMFTLYFWLFG